MTVRLFRPTLLGVILIVTGCALPQRGMATRNAQTIRLASHEQLAQKTVYVVGHGWHTGVVLRASDVSAEIWPEVRDFSNIDFVEFGWGDEGFYRAKKITAPLVLKAAFWPTPSVMHVVGFSGPVKRFTKSATLSKFN